MGVILGQIEKIVQEYYNQRQIEQVKAFRPKSYEEAVQCVDKFIQEHSLPAYSHLDFDPITGEVGIRWRAEDLIHFKMHSNLFYVHSQDLGIFFLPEEGGSWAHSWIEQQMLRDLDLKGLYLTPPDLIKNPEVLNQYSSIALTSLQSISQRKDKE